MPLRSSHQRYSVKKGVLENFAKFTGKQLCWSLLVIKLQASQVFCCEFCDIFKKTYFEENMQTAASGHCHIKETDHRFQSLDKLVVAWVLVHNLF